MAKSSSLLKWCTVRLGDDMNWWVQETSDPIHWDTDCLSILDPKQFQYVLELMEPLRDYGLQLELFDLAFYPFAIQQDLGDGLIKLEPSNDNLLESDDKLFALPDILNEDKSPYADFLTHITKMRIKLLNDMIEFEQPLTVEDIEDELREKQNADFIEGRSTHVFAELTDILEYIPHGYELDLDGAERKHPSSEENVEFDTDLPEVEEDDSFEGDETMRWNDEEEEDKEKTDDELGSGFSTFSPDDEDLDEKPKQRSKEKAPAKATTKTTPKASKKK